MQSRSGLPSFLAGNASIRSSGLTVIAGKEHGSWDSKVGWRYRRGLGMGRGSVGGIPLAWHRTQNWM